MKEYEYRGNQIVEICPNQFYFYLMCEGDEDTFEFGPYKDLREAQKAMDLTLDNDCGLFYMRNDR